MPCAVQLAYKRSARIATNIDEESTRNGPEIVPESTQHRPKIGTGPPPDPLGRQRGSRERSRAVPGGLGGAPGGNVGAPGDALGSPGDPPGAPRDPLGDHVEAPRREKRASRARFATRLALQARSERFSDDFFKLFLIDFWFDLQAIRHCGWSCGRLASNGADLHETM